MHNTKNTLVGVFAFVGVQRISRASLSENPRFSGLSSTGKLPFPRPPSRSRLSTTQKHPHGCFCFCRGTETRTLTKSSQTTRASHYTIPRITMTLIIQCLSSESKRKRKAILMLEESPSSTTNYATSLLPGRLLISINSIILLFDRNA